jgi:hypothetical protein
MVAFAPVGELEFKTPLLFPEPRFAFPALELTTAFVFVPVFVFMPVFALPPALVLAPGLFPLLEFIPLLPLPL